MRHIMFRAVVAGASASLLCLAACDPIDPLKRDYMWHPTEVNRANIAAQAAYPEDLIHGRGDVRHGVALDQMGVDTALSAKPKPLISAATGGGS